MSRDRLIFLAVTAAVVFLVFDPFSARGSRIKGVDQKTQLALYTRIVEDYETPEAYLVSLLGDHDVVLIGEHQNLATQLIYVKNLIPALDAAGVKNLGIEYANASDQALIDAVLTSPEYDAEAVNGILFRYLVLWGFKEYADLFYEAWKTNASHGPEEDPFRILGLNIERNWSAIHSAADLDNPEARKAVIAAGLPDQKMAEALFREVVDKGGKAAVLCNFQSSFTRFRFKGYVENAEKQGLPSTLRLGNFMYEQLGDRAFSVFLHGPWHDERAKYGIDYPFSGAVDKLIRTLPPEKQLFGVSTANSPFGELEVTGSYSVGYARLTLGEMADGYIVLGPLKDYTPVTPIPGFINENNISEAIAEFPGPDPGNVGPDALNQYIASIPEDYARTLSSLK